MPNCYVCNTEVNLEIDEYCERSETKNSDTLEYRHYWHGVPGITRTAPSAGIAGYAMTLTDAKRRANYYIYENHWAAPEVKNSEKLVLYEVKRIERLNMNIFSKTLDTFNNIYSRLMLNKGKYIEIGRNGDRRIYEDKKMRQ